jgi:hypothetical protein
MGLDISFYATTSNALTEDTDYGFEVKNKAYNINQEFGYFRKDGELRDILFDYYVNIGGNEPKEEFNCMNLRVTQKLVDYVRNRYEPTYDYYKEVLETLKRAEGYLQNEQLALYCFCWW